MRAWLIGASFVPSKIFFSQVLDELHLQITDLRVGVDGGAKTWLELGWEPHFAVGDWDSLGSTHRLLGRIPHLSLSRHKDRSDLYYAARAAIAIGAQELVCLGVTGGPRLDHHLATLFDLSEFSTGKYGKLRSVRAVDREEDCVFLSESIPTWTGVLKKQQKVSVFALGGVVEGVTLDGFKYPLKNADLLPSSLGLSNRVAKRNCEVCLRKGQLLVIIRRHWS